MRGPSSHREEGAVLLTTLLLMSFMATLAVAIATDTRASVRRTVAIEDGRQASHYLAGAEAFALATIAQRFAELDADALNSALRTPQVLTFPIGDGLITVSVTDGSHCLSPTDALDANGQRRLSNLFTSLGVPPFEAQSLTVALTDWQDPDQNPQAGGAEDAHYLLQPVPYRTADTPITAPFEMRAVRGFTSERYAALAPWLCVRGAEVVAVNANTLGPQDAPLLAATLGASVFPERAVSLLADRPEEGWTDTSLDEALERNGFDPSERVGLGTQTDTIRADIRVTYRGRERVARLYTDRGGNLLSREAGEALSPSRPLQTGAVGTEQNVQESSP